MTISKRVELEGVLFGLTVLFGMNIIPIFFALYVAAIILSAVLFVFVVCSLYVEENNQIANKVLNIIELVFTYIVPFIEYMDGYMDVVKPEMALTIIPGLLTRTFLFSMFF
jgi:hypothetical protein